MPKGISIFTGLNYTLEENLNYIVFAKENGFQSIFTSLHIPEADYKRTIDEFINMVEFSNKNNMNVIADISPRTFKYLGVTMNDMKYFKELGLYGIRVDFGFTAKEIAEFTKNPYDIKIEINASTVNEKFLNEFRTFEPNYSNIQACHNYYPRLNTGISIDTFNYKNKLLRKYGINISAFIPSLINKRAPLFEGLPTLENHRFMEPQIAAKHLFVLGINNVIFGDSIPTNKEIETVGRVDENILELRIKAFTSSKIERDILFNHIHTNRPDNAEDVIRSTSSREHINEVIEPYNNIERIIGFITIDNKDYLRYCGELQICKKNLPADNRVNVVGKVIDEEIFLINYINEESKFKFIETK
ncbi:hypothetical protein SAMN05443428_11751 [Caloramator quimbayensis]|uniref:Outer surface protein n=1 Tax=Caloramator quimbayensis TaxID=1147123 RepID=A0A1T4Y094_9CLOT|nr:MupG family TIM beta-alpha barrel fold protein [Caloramator quimbayensis]SKA95196.1 hypothetical protein SAMN05443428_11751 [Caloramator quimbayensis]